MKPATVKQIRDELKQRPASEVLALCLRLAVFKKENKELLTYLLFEADDEEGYIREIKNEVDELFAEINTTHAYYAKKGIRKVLRNLKKYIRYSKNKATEVELLIYFCEQIKSLKPSIRRSTAIDNLFHRQIALVKRKIPALHEDLQYDFNLEVDALF